MKNEQIKIGDFVEHVFYKDLADPIKMKFLSEQSSTYDEHGNFDSKRINYNRFVEINSQNIDYIKQFLHMFIKPNKDDLIQFLIESNKFEKVIEIKNGAYYSNLLTLDETHERNLDVLKEIIEMAKNRKK